MQFEFVPSIAKCSGVWQCPLWLSQFSMRTRKARDVLPEIFGTASAAKMLKPRGRPKSGRARTSISLRLPPETLARWKATGPGWQTRMAEALSRAAASIPPIDVPLMKRPRIPKATVELPLAWLS
jgi:uncharacterized protein (DUF4415 family)